MVIGGELAFWRRLQTRRNRVRRLRHYRPECEMAVVALIEGLDQVKPGGRERRGDLSVRHSPPAHDVNCMTKKVIAVGDTANGTVMFDRSEGARDDPEWRSDPRRGRRKGLSRNRIAGMMRPFGCRRCANEHKRPQQSVPSSHISLPLKESV